MPMYCGGWILWPASYTRYDPEAGDNREWDVGQHVGTVVQRASGGLMLALRDGFAAFDPGSGDAGRCLSIRRLICRATDLTMASAIPRGRFWAGTMAYEDQSEQGSVYRMDTDHSVHKVIGDIGISNGIIWSLDAKTMYYTDSLDFAIRAYDYDVETGGISNERVIISIPEEMGFADGFTIDEEGMAVGGTLRGQPCAALESGNGYRVGGGRAADSQYYGVRIRRSGPGSALHHERVVPDERRGEGRTAPCGRVFRSGCGSAGGCIRQVRGLRGGRENSKAVASGTNWPNTSSNYPGSLQHAKMAGV